jgi:DNA-binding GntR family transcriptional regulator
MTKVDRVCESIVGGIESGSLRGGDRLPSEEQLAERLGVSVGTVQKALAQLASSGIVSREHGRGTFVSGARTGLSDVAYLRFRDARGAELPQFVRVRSVRRETRRGPWTDFLGDDAACVRITRTIGVADRFELHGEFWLREPDFARLDGVDARTFETNLRVLLGQRLALPTLDVEQSIRFERLPARIAARIGHDPQAPGFVMEILGRTLRERPLFFQRVCAPPFSERLMILR